MKPPIHPGAPDWGGKGASLEKLRQHARVPRFQVLPAGVFRQFLEAEDLLELYLDHWALALNEQTQSHAARIREVLLKWCLKGPLPSPVSDELQSVFGKMAGTLCIARSSATVEDGRSGSWAGQFVSVPGIDSPETWEQAVRTCWASLLRPAAPFYAKARSLTDEPPGMAVILQEMVDARASGVWFPFHPAEGSDDPVMECTLGLGSPLVSGRLSPERWAGKAGEKPRRIRGLRAGEVQLPANGHSSEIGTGRVLGRWVEIRKDPQPVRHGIWTGHPVSTLPGDIPVLSEEEAAAVIREGQALAGREPFPVEMEWAIDMKGELHWLQMRPVTVVPAPAAQAPSGENGLLMRGLCAQSGRVEGIAWEYGRPRPGGESVILIKEELSPEDIQLLLSVQGMVARDGSLLSHTAIVCREFGIPCLVDAGPFPPEISLHGRAVVLEAHSGRLLPLGPPPLLPAPVAATVPEAPGTRSLTGLHWPGSEGFREKVPPHLKQKLARIAALPGLVSGVNVLPDLRERSPENGLGFPVGLAFRSACYHPAAACDMGDGFRVMRFTGLSGEEAGGRLPALVAALNDELRADKRRGFPLERIYGEGVAALRGTEWEEPASGLVEESGQVPGADPAMLMSGVASSLAQQLLATPGSPGHFLDLYLSRDPQSGAAGEEGELIWLLHTGAVDLGVEFIRLAMERGRLAAMREGLFDPDTVREGLFGLDPSGTEGRELLAAALALINYGFARRRILATLVERAMEKVFGAGGRLELVSDVLHTAVRPVGDGLLQQQGVQARRPGGLALPLVLSSAPGAVSYLLKAEGKGAQEWVPHGKIYLPPDDRFREDELARTWRQSTLVLGELGIDDKGGAAKMHAQAREALEISCRDAGMQVRSKLFPLLCYRGEV